MDRTISERRPELSTCRRHNGLSLRAGLERGRGAALPQHSRTTACAETRSPENRPGLPRRRPTLLVSSKLPIAAIARDTMHNLISNWWHVSRQAESRQPQPYLTDLTRERRGAMAPLAPLAALLVSSVGTAASPVVTNSHRALQGAADATDLCGDSCEVSATRGAQAVEERMRRRRNCRATWSQGCQNAPPPRGFTASSTLWEMCPHSCPSTINPRTAPVPPPGMLLPPPAPPPTAPGDLLSPPAPVPSAILPEVAVAAPEAATTTDTPPLPLLPPPPPPPPAQQQEQQQQQQRAGKGPDKQVLRAEIRTRMLGAAYDFLYGMSVATIVIFCAVFYCRRRKRTMQRMGMASRCDLPSHLFCLFIFRVLSIRSPSFRDSFSPGKLAADRPARELAAVVSRDRPHGRLEGLVLQAG